ncbi:hypothetical protein [Glutamicibacter sp. TV12E]|uniref:hypothetical protein n=1 Tax=Glutamicibacter sp. TV12E TaxID=3446362 RepID=UPI0040344D4A
MSNPHVERFFPSLTGAAAKTPADIARMSEAKRRREVHQDVKVANDRLRAALNVTYDFDSTGNVASALNHVITRGDQLVVALRRLREVSEPFIEKQATK